MRQHTALTTAALVFRAEHEELRVALGLPRYKPVTSLPGFRRRPSMRASRRARAENGARARPRHAGDPSASVVRLWSQIHRFTTWSALEKGPHRKCPRQTTSNPAKTA